jgi:hypothetical protein
MKDQIKKIEQLYKEKDKLQEQIDRLETKIIKIENPKTIEGFKIDETVITNEKASCSNEKYVGNIQMLETWGKKATEIPLKGLQWKIKRFVYNPHYKRFRVQAKSMLSFSLPTYEFDLWEISKL